MIVVEDKTEIEKFARPIHLTSNKLHKQEMSTTEADLSMAPPKDHAK